MVPGWQLRRGTYSFVDTPERTHRGVLTAWSLLHHQLVRFVQAAASSGGMFSSGHPRSIAVAEIIRNTKPITGKFSKSRAMTRDLGMIESDWGRNYKAFLDTTEITD